MAEVRFIRRNGKVIPIRVKKGSGSKGGKLRAERNIQQKAGKALIPAANVALIGAFLGKPFSIISEHKGRFEAARTSALAKHTHQMQKVMKKTGTLHHSHAEFDKYKKATMKSFKKQKRLHTVSKFLGRSKTLWAVALGTTVASAVLQTKGNKRRSRETRMLNQ